METACTTNMKETSGSAAAGEALLHGSVSGPRRDRAWPRASWVRARSSGGRKSCRQSLLGTDSSQADQQVLAVGGLRQPSVFDATRAQKKRAQCGDS